MSVKLRSKKLSDGSESLYLDLYIRGVRRYEFLGIQLRKNDPEKKHKKEIAEMKRSKRELELLANYHDVPKNFNGDEDFLEYFQTHLTDNYTKTVYNDFNKFVKTKNFNGKLPFKFLSEKLIEEYRDQLVKTKKNSSACMYLVKIKTILNKAIKDKMIVISPAKYVRLKLNDIEKVYLVEKELKQMIDKIDPEIDNEVKKAFVFSCFTGLRISDVRKLKWSQIKENKLFFAQTKTKGFEYLPLSESAKKYLFMDVKPEDIQPDKRVFNLCKDDITNKRLKIWVTKAEIDKKVTFHTARHTFATLSLTSGIDIYTVSKMMGHKSVKMTEIYAKIINKSVEEAVTRLPQL